METDSEYLKPQNRTKYVVYLFRRVTATLLANTGVYVLQLNRRGLEVFHCRRKLRRICIQNKLQYAVKILPDNDNTSSCNISESCAAASTSRA